MTHAYDDPGYQALRVKALESLLVEKGLLATDTVDAVVARFEQDIGPLERRARRRPRLGRPRVQAAPAHRRHPGDRRARDRRHAGREHGCPREHARGAQRRRLHALLLLSVAGARFAADVVQGPAYRARPVVEPRAVLPSWALDPDDVEVRVWDSSAEIRYLVVPERPAGTEDLAEEKLPPWLLATR